MSFLLNNLLIGNGGTSIKDSGTALSSVGASIDAGNIVKTVTASSNTYSHTLGKIPKLIFISGNYNNSSCVSGTYLTSTNTNKCNHSGATRDSYIWIYEPGATYWRGYISAISSTDFTITWQTNTSGVEYYFSWVAIG